MATPSLRSHRDLDIGWCSRFCQQFCSRWRIGKCWGTCLKNASFLFLSAIFFSQILNSAFHFPRNLAVHIRNISISWPHLRTAWLAWDPIINDSNTCCSEVNRILGCLWLGQLWLRVQEPLVKSWKGKIWPLVRKMLLKNVQIPFLGYRDR